MTEKISFLDLFPFPQYEKSQDVSEKKIKLNSLARALDSTDVYEYDNGTELKAFIHEASRNLGRFSTSPHSSNTKSMKRFVTIVNSHPKKDDICGVFKIDKNKIIETKDFDGYIGSLNESSKRSKVGKKGPVIESIEDERRASDPGQRKGSFGNINKPRAQSDPTHNTSYKAVEKPNTLLTRLQKAIASGAQSDIEENKSSELPSERTPSLGGFGETVNVLPTKASFISNGESMANQNGVKYDELGLLDFRSKEKDHLEPLPQKPLPQKPREYVSNPGWNKLKKLFGFKETTNKSESKSTSTVELTESGLLDFRPKEGESPAQKPQAQKSFLQKLMPEYAPDTAIETFVKQFKSSVESKSVKPPTSGQTLGSNKNGKGGNTGQGALGR